MIALFLLLAPEVGLASLYRPAPGSVYADGGRPRPTDAVCAHRTLPLGSRVRVTLGQRSTVALVRDRGPWGACVPGRGVGRSCPAGYRWRALTRLPRGGWWRGVLDCTPAVWARLGARGWRVVRVEALPPATRGRRLVAQRGLPCSRCGPARWCRRMAGHTRRADMPSPRPDSTRLATLP